MVIKGRTRGGGRQLANYLLTKGDNEQVGLLYVDGQERFSEQDFRQLLGDFSLTEKLTRSKKGIYHVTINPPEGIDQRMSKEHWLQAASVLTEELGMGEQRMAMVLHQKNGKRHLHIAIERYNHETGKVIPIDHNYRKHLKAGQKIAQHLGLQPLPERNPKRKPMKEALTTLWHDTQDATGFIRQAKQQGYMVCKGYDRKPFLVVDETTGRSFNLVRHLENIQTRAVRERLKGSVLMEEREAVAFVRTRKTATESQPEQETLSASEAFLQNIQQTRKQQRTHKPKMR